jgi:hypothetical protein
MIELSSADRQAILDGKAVRVPLPELGQDVVILSAALFESLDELLQDDREREAIVKMAMRNTAQRILEDEND